MSILPNSTAIVSLGERSSINRTASEQEGKVEVASELILEISNVAWFLLKNNQRKQLYSGNVKIITHPNSADYLIFVFESLEDTSKKYTYVLSKQCLVMKIFPRNYVFSGNDEFFGLIADWNTPHDVISSLETIIEEYSRLKVKSGENACSLLEKYVENNELYCGPPDQIALIGLKLAEYIRLGTVKLVEGIRFVSEKSGTGLKAGGDKLKERIVPNEQPLKVSPTTQSSIAKAKLAGKTAATVSSALVTGAMVAANALSTQITASFNNSEMGQKISGVENPKMKAAKEVVKSTISGAVILLDETVNAGLHVVKEATNATADVVGHKYGTEVRVAAKDVGDIVNDTATAAANVNRLGVSALARRVAATTAVDVLSTEEERKNNQMSRVQIDPITGMQVLMVANQLDQMSQNQKNESVRKRQEYVGLIPQSAQPPNNYESRNNDNSIDVD